jgi:hypothetical protein
MFKQRLPSADFAWNVRRYRRERKYWPNGKAVTIAIVKWIAAWNLREGSLVEEVRQMGDLHELQRLRTHINELQLALLPLSGQVGTHQYTETKAIQIGHFCQVQYQALCLMD